MLTTRLLVGLSLLFSLSGCHDKGPYPVLVHVGFLPSVTITPSARTLHLGDTLWLEANFSDSLLDLNSGHRYRVRPQDLPLHSAIFYEKLLGIGQQPAGIANTFRIVERLGQASLQGTFTSSFEPVYDGHYYRARIGLIPTKACVTSISMIITPANGDKDQLLSFIQLPLDAQGREQKAQLDDSFYIINAGKANNFDLYQQYFKSYSLEPGTPLKPIIFEQKSTFTVEVK